MFRRQHPVILCLAFCALAWAQVMGLTRGYVCEHNGKTVETMADHHHKGDALHSDHLVNHSPHHHDDEDEEDTERHTPLKVEMSVPQISGAFSVQPIAWVDCTLGDFLTLTMVPMLAVPQIYVPPDPWRVPLPASLVVAQCVVLLV